MIKSAPWFALLLCGLAPGLALAASVTVDHPPVMLGKSESVGVEIAIEEPPGSEDVPLRVAVNVGAFSDLHRTGPGLYRAVYLPPRTRFPQMALIAVWRESGPEGRIDFLRIPLYGATKIPVASRPGFEVSIKVGDAVFGPVIADGAGRATVVAEVPPGVREATILGKDANGLVNRKQVPIEVPSYNRLTAALVPHAILADGTSFTRLDAFYDLGGAGVTPDKVKVKASLGEAVFQKADHGLYSFKYTPPQGTTVKGVDFTLSIEGDPAATATAKLSLGLPPAAKVVVRPPAKPLAADGKASSTVTVLVFDDRGMGVPGQQPELRANGEPLADATATYLGNGAYQFQYVAPGTYPPGGLVQFEARLTSASGAVTVGSTNYQLKPTLLPQAMVMRVVPSPVPADGRTEARVVFDVRDSAGLPLRSAQLIAVASHGALGALSETGDGLYAASYVAPARPPEGDVVIRMVDSSGAFEKSVPMPLREDPHHLLLGVRAGYSHSLAELKGPRAGLDLWAPFRVGGASFGAGLSATYASASQTVTTADRALSSKSEVAFIPITLRAGYEAWASRRLSLTLGAGAVATYARFRTSLTGATAAQVGYGGLGFLSMGAALGPGQAFADLNYALAPVQAGEFHLDAGGIGLEVGYRIGLF